MKRIIILQILIMICMDFSLVFFHSFFYYYTDTVKRIIQGVSSLIDHFRYCLIDKRKKNSSKEIRGF